MSTTRRLSETTATRLRQAVDQMRAVLSIVGEESTDEPQPGLHGTLSESRLSGGSARTLDQSDSYFCTTNLAAAAAALEKILDNDDASTQAASSPQQQSHHASPAGGGFMLAVPGADGLAAQASHASMGNPGTSAVMAPSIQSPTDSLLDGSSEARPLSPSSDPFSKAAPAKKPTSKGKKDHRSASVMEIPGLAVQGATPSHSFVSRDPRDHAPDSGRSGSKQMSASRDGIVVDEVAAGDTSVAQWLNGTFADQHKRESTGFEMKLQRSNSIMSSLSVARANDKDDDDGAGLFEQSGSRLLPDGTELVPTRYARTNQRSYPAFCSERKYTIALRTAGIERVEGINDSDFDIFPHLKKHGEGVFTVICANVFLQYNFMNSLGVNIGYFVNFLRELEKHYFMTNPYHNGAHAADVLQTTNVYLCTGDVKENFSDVELIAILFGAMAHDVGHPGTTNAFLQKAQHPLAKLYNDLSTLESMHCAMAFILLDKPECNFFETSKTWTRAHDADFRALAIEVILGTDMKHHAAMTADVCDILEDGQIDDDEVARLFKAIVHAADLSNPMKPQHVYLNWMERVNAEFWQQGDEEKRRGMDVSIMCDRDKPNVFKSQIGFIEFVVRPFMQELAPVLPPIWIERLQRNLEYVKSGDAEEEAACTKRIQALSAKRWVDVPIRQHSFFTVVMRYFDAYRLSSQLAYNDDLSPGASMNEPPSPMALGISASSNPALRGRSSSRNLTTSNALQSTIEVHHCRLAEECERWMHQIASYRPIDPEALQRRRRSTKTNSQPGSPVPPGFSGSPNEMPLMMAGPGGTSIQVSLPVDTLPASDDEFHERLCLGWLTTILELQLQLRMQGHQEIDDIRLGSSALGGNPGSSASSFFVPYLEEAAAKVILDSEVGAVLIRRRLEEERRVTASHRTNHEAEIEERQRITASMRLRADKKPRRASVSFEGEGGGVSALDAILSDVGATDVSQPDEDQGTTLAVPDGAAAAADDDDDSGSDEGSRTFSWIKKPPRGSAKGNSSLPGSIRTHSTATPGVGTSPNGVTMLQHSASGRMTLYQSVKKSEYIADEDLLLEAIRQNPKLAALAVDRIVRGEEAAAKASAEPAAPERRSVRVIEPVPEMSPKHARKTGMVRFVNALTKTLVVAFSNHVKRSKEQLRQRALSSATTVDPAAAAASQSQDPGSNAATIDAGSVLNNTQVRDRTNKWLEDLYADMAGEPGRRASQSTASVSNKSRSPGPTFLPTIVSNSPPQAHLSAAAEATSTRSEAASSRRPSNRSEVEPLPSHAGTEPHAFFTPDDRSIPAGPAAVLIGIPPAPSTPSGFSSNSAQPSMTTPAGPTPEASPKRAASSNGRPPRSPVSVNLTIPTSKPTASMVGLGGSSEDVSTSNDGILFIDHQAGGGAAEQRPAVPLPTAAADPQEADRPKASNPALESSLRGTQSSSLDGSALFAAGSPSAMLRKSSAASTVGAGSSTGTHPHNTAHSLVPAQQQAPPALAAGPRQGVLRTDSVLRYVNNARRLDCDRLTRTWEDRVLSFTDKKATGDPDDHSGGEVRRARTSADVFSDERADIGRGPQLRTTRAASSSIARRTDIWRNPDSNTPAALPPVKPGNRTPGPL